MGQHSPPRRAGSVFPFSVYTRRAAKPAKWCQISARAATLLSTLAFPGKACSHTLTLERGRSIDPKQPRLRAAWIAPAMRRGALEIKAVAGVQAIVLPFAKPNFKRSAQDVQKFLAFMRVGFPAAATGFHAKKVRLHGGIAPGQQFHAHAGIGLQNFSLRRTHQAGIVSRGFEKGNDIGAIEARDAPQRGNGRTHLSALE